MRMEDELERMEERMMGKVTQMVSGMRTEMVALVGHLVDLRSSLDTVMSVTLPDVHTDLDMLTSSIHAVENYVRTSNAFSARVANVLDIPLGTPTEAIQCPGKKDPAVDTVLASADALLDAIRELDNSPRKKRSQGAIGAMHTAEAVLEVPESRGDLTMVMEMEGVRSEMDEVRRDVQDAMDALEKMGERVECVDEGLGGRVEVVEKVLADLVVRRRSGMDERKVNVLWEEHIQAREVYRSVEGVGSGAGAGAGAGAGSGSLASHPVTFGHLSTLLQRIRSLESRTRRHRSTFVK